MKKIFSQTRKTDEILIKDFEKTSRILKRYYSKSEGIKAHHDSLIEGFEKKEIDLDAYLNEKSSLTQKGVPIFQEGKVSKKRR